MKLHYLLSLLLLCSLYGFSQTTTFERPYTYKTKPVVGYCGIQTKDGGYATIADNDPTIYFVKTDRYGDTLWTRNYSNGTQVTGLGVDGRWLSQTSDGGYIIAGQAVRSPNGHTGQLYIKLDSTGKVLWTRYFDPLQNTFAFALVGNNQLYIEETMDKGFVSCGSQSHFSYSGVITRLDSTGSYAWVVRPGNAVNISEVHQTADSGYIAIGTGPGAVMFSEASFLYKLNKSGILQWTKSFQGVRYNSIKKTNNGGYVLAGERKTGTVPHTEVALLDSAGDTVWTKMYNAASHEIYQVINCTDDGGFVVSGTTRDCGDDSTDVFIMKLDAAGTLLWRKVYGGPKDENSTNVMQCADGGFIISGNTYSFGNALFPFMPGRSNSIYMVKTDNNGNVLCNRFVFSAVSDSVICFGDTVRIANASHACNGYTYQMFWDGTPEAGDEILKANVGPGTHTVKIVGNNGVCSDSLIHTVTFLPAPPKPVITQTGNQLSTGAAAAYQWFYNGSPVSGANSSSYNISSSGSYFVQIMDTAGCMALSDTVSVVYTGIAEKGSLEISIFPVPVKDFLTIRYTGTFTEALQVRIYDMSGKMQSEYLLRDKADRIPVSLEPGMYILSIRGRGLNVYRKLLVN
jgi:hypothetical protein